MEIHHSLSKTRANAADPPVSLFFDLDWFETRMAERGLTRAALAAGAGLSEAQLELVFKDQRELTADEVGALAEMLGASPADVAERAGVSTPVPGDDAVEARLALIEARLAALEAALRCAG